MGPVTDVRVRQPAKHDPVAPKGKVPATDSAQVGSRGHEVEVIAFPDLAG